MSEGLKYRHVDAENVTKRTRDRVGHFPTVLTRSPIEALLNTPDGIDQATLFPQNAPALTETYNTLTAQIQSPQNPQRRLLAIVIGDIIYHQTGLPPKEKAYATMGSQFNRGLLLDVTGQLAAQERPTEDSIAAAHAFQTARDEAAAEFDRPLEEFTFANDEAEFMGKAANAGTMYALTDSPLFRLYASLGAEGSADRIGRYHGRYIERVAADPLSLEPLLRDELSAVHPVELFAWMHHQARANLKEDTTDTPDRLKNYFFEHPSIQMGFWNYATRNPEGNFLPRTVDETTSRITVVPETYLIADWFLTHAKSSVVKAFLRSAPLDETQGTDKAMYATRLVDYAALFKTFHPDHPNLPIIIDTVKHVLKETSSRKATSGMMDVLTDQVPGVIYVVPDRFQPGKPYVGIPKPSESMDTVVATVIEGVGTNNVHYISTKEHEALQTRPAATRLPHRQSVETTEAAPFFDLPPGENVLRPGWYWPEIQVPQADTVPPLLKHLQTQFTEDDYLDLVTDLNPLYIKDHGVTHVRRKAAVIPHTLPQSDQLHALSKPGILGVLREYNDITVLLDADAAKISTEGSRVVALHGRLDNDGFMVIDNAPEDFTDSPLHLAITAAALKTHQLAGRDQQPKTRKAKPIAVGGAGSPLVVSDYPGINEMGVVVQIGMDQEITHSTLKPAA